MRVFRLHRKKYKDRLNGLGASLSASNRWNSRGTEIIYTSDSRALAMAEVAVHLNSTTVPSDYVMLEIEIPKTVSLSEIHTQNLPPNWHAKPPLAETRELGDRFIFDRSHCILKAPSAVVRGDFNFLLSPRHADFGKIKIVGWEDFPFDERLWRG